MKDKPKTEVIRDLNELREQASAKADEAQSLMDAAEQEGRQLSAEEQAAFDAALEASEALQAEYNERLAEDHHAARRAALADLQKNLDSNPTARTVLNQGPLSQVSHLRVRFYDDPKRGFEHLGEFAAAVFNSGLPNTDMDERLNKIRFESAATGMSQGVGADGGILVPPSFRNEIWTGMQSQVDNLLARTDQYPVTGESLTMPASAETSRATGSRYGGIQGYWLAEAAQMTSSKPKLRQMKLEPQELAVLVYVTDKLLRNAPALNAFVSRAASEEILFLINDAIINGNGVGQPLGILNGGGLVTVAKETGQAAATLVLDNIHKMWSRMFAPARANAVWLVNQDVEPQLEDLAATVGTGGVPVYLPQGASGPTITESPNARLKGRPVLPVEYCATLGTVGDILLVNLQYYATGLKGAMRDDMSIHLRFDYNETAFRFLFEVDGQPWMNNVLTPFKGSATKSAYVALATRA